MARCGRCGLWNRYPEDHPEQKYAGVCLWYQLRLHENEVYEQRECDDFLEKIPGHSAAWHFDHVASRDKMAHAFTSLKKSHRRAKIALGLSITSLTWSFIEFLLS